MDSSQYQNKGLYFEEFEIGQRFKTVSRTITEGDIVTFAGLSGDYTQLHTDKEFAKNTPYGRRIAHGLLGMAIASGLTVRSGVIEGTALAFREVNNWKFSNPIYIGDTIHVNLEVINKKALPRLGGGSVLIQMIVKNQRDENTMRGVWTVLVASKPKE
jgi:acyl dehydratase